MSTIKPEPAALEASRGPRVARRRLERLDEYVSLLRRAKSTVPAFGQEKADPLLQKLINDADAMRGNLQVAAEGRVFRRKRPKNSVPSPADSCLVFIDECGAHALGAKDTFPVFCLAAVIVRESGWRELDLLMRAWKVATVGDENFVIHEPEIRYHLGPWGKPEREALLELLREQLVKLDFTVVACVLRRAEFVKDFGVGPLDESLPGHPYLMALDFLIERVLMVLDDDFKGGRAKVVAESRGALEDALLQYEFARLHLDGTSYIHSSWFRQQMHPGVHFEHKGGQYATGLQLADLSARPIAEKVVAPGTTPERWPEIARKLCRGQGTKNSILGLKIIPWDSAFEKIWET
jgi:hypothetical protein